MLVLSLNRSEFSKDIVDFIAPKARLLFRVYSPSFSEYLTANSGL